MSNNKSTEILIKRLLAIEQLCDPEVKMRAVEEAESNLDPFTILKRELASDIKVFKEKASNRNDKLAEGTVDRATLAKEGGILRNDLEQINEKAERLKKLHRKNRRKVKGKEDGADQLELQERVIDLLDQHLEQCGDVIEGGNGATLFDSSSSAQYTTQNVGYLPSIDAPEFELLRVNDAKIDDKLLQVYDAVTRIKEIQKIIGAEIDDQDKLIDHLEKDAENATQQLVKLNKRVADTIKKVGGARDLCCDCCLFICILGVIGVIYSLLT